MTIEKHHSAIERLKLWRAVVLDGVPREVLRGRCPGGELVSAAATRSALLYAACFTGLAPIAVNAGSHAGTNGAMVEGYAPLAGRSNSRGEA